MIKELTDFYLFQIELTLNYSLVNHRDPLTIFWKNVNMILLIVRTSIKFLMETISNNNNNFKDRACNPSR